MQVTGYQTARFIIGYIMTRPSDFTINSDYMSIAQTNRSEVTVNVESGTVATDITITQDFALKAAPGSVSRFMIRKNSEPFTIGNELITQLVWDTNKVIGHITVYRISDSLFRFSVTYQNFASSASTYPAATYTVKITTFKSPNDF